MSIIYLKEKERVTLQHDGFLSLTCLDGLVLVSLLLSIIHHSSSKIGAQMNLDQKASMAQFVIENSGSLFDTTDQVGVNYRVATKIFEDFDAFQTAPPLKERYFPLKPLHMVMLD